jgi:hypothetical protein
VTLLTERCAEHIAGVVSCYDRIVILGTLPSVCYAAGMAAYLRSNNIRLFDYPRFAEPLHTTSTRAARGSGNDSSLVTPSI